MAGRKQTAGTHLSIKQLDALCREARERRCSVSAVLREALTEHFDARAGGLPRTADELREHVLSWYETFSRVDRAIEAGRATFDDIMTALERGPEAFRAERNAASDRTH